MSEPDQIVPAGAPRSDPPPTEPMQRVPLARPAPWHAWLAWAALAIALFTAAWVWPRVGGLESEATRRLQGSDQRVAELEAALKYAQDQLRDTQNRTAVLESRVLETAGLQAQLEKLYRSLASDSTDMLLVEIESALALANQQLVLGTHPQVALGALQEIDLRLGRQDDPSLAGVRRALLSDIDRLKAFPAADVGALALRLDSLIGTIDMFPLAASVRAPAQRPASQRGANGEAAAAPDRAARAPGGDAGDASARAGGASARTTDAGSRTDAAVRATDAASRATDAAAAGLGVLRDELQQLFRVRRIDTPDAVLVAPEQAYFLRQNLRLLLLNARLALLSRNEALFRSDLERVAHWLRAYYDGEHRGVAAAAAQLRQMMGARIALEAPTLAESLAATRAARAARDARR